MGRETAIDQLTQEHKRQLDDKLFDNGFNGYVELADWLRSLGYKISKSSVHRYGKKMEDRLDAVRDATEMAKLFAENVSDDAADLSAATIAMVQTEAFNALVALEDIKNAKNAEDRLATIAKVSKSLAELSRANINQKKWQNEVKERVEAAAKRVEEIASKGGLTGADAEKIRAEILGISK